jgi:hypothetical protein
MRSQDGICGFESYGADDRALAISRGLSVWSRTFRAFAVSPSEFFE